LNNGSVLASGERWCCRVCRRVLVSPGTEPPEPCTAFQTDLLPRYTDISIQKGKQVRNALVRATRGIDSYTRQNSIHEQDRFALQHILVACLTLVASGTQARNRFSEPGVLEFWLLMYSSYRRVGGPPRKQLWLAKLYGGMDDLDFWSNLGITEALFQRVAPKDLTEMPLAASAEEASFIVSATICPSLTWLLTSYPGLISLAIADSSQWELS
jgi:hypothetical protein